MIQSRHYHITQRSVPVLYRNRLLQHHPVLTPVFLLAGSFVLGSAGFLSNNPFPLLALLGVPVLPLCISIALVLGISGILISIVSLIERFDRSGIQTVTIPRSSKAKGAEL